MCCQKEHKHTEAHTHTQRNVSLCVWNSSVYLRRQRQVPPSDSCSPESDSWKRNNVIFVHTFTSLIDWEDDNFAATSSLQAVVRKVWFLKTEQGHHCQHCWLNNFMIFIIIAFVYVLILSIPPWSFSKDQWFFPPWFRVLFSLWIDITYAVIVDCHLFQNKCVSSA